VSATVREAIAADFPWIIDLIDRNRAEALTAEERAAKGFVQGQWDVAVLERLSAGLGIFVAEVDGHPAGVAISSAAGAIPSGPAGRTSELAAAAYPAGTFFLYGPVVVDDAFRRRGVLRALLAHLGRELGGRYVTAIAFVEVTNTASMGAHTRLGFRVFQSFEEGGRSFHAMSLELRELSP
jgi:ribosomal protein S18 acetylase RimI-like enzyme